MKIMNSETPVAKRKMKDVRRKSLDGSSELVLSERHISLWLKNNKGAAKDAF